MTSSILSPVKAVRAAGTQLSDAVESRGMTARSDRSTYLVPQHGDGKHPVVDHWLLKLAARRYGSGNIHPTDEQRESFKQWKLTGDPLADALVQRIKNGGGQALRLKFETALTEGIDAVEDPPQELVDLFREIETVPYWVDPEKLERGSRAYQRSGPDGALMFVMAVAGSYLSPDANAVVLLTREMVDKAAKRSVETMAWIHDVTARGSLYPGGTGYQAAVRLRLTHAFMRSGIRNRKDWPESDLPVNQSTYVATPILLSLAATWLGNALGNLTTAKDREAIFHLWRYISYLIGVNPNLAITDEHDAFRLLAVVVPQELVINEQTVRDGRFLSKALIDSYDVISGYDLETWTGRARLRMDKEVATLVMNVGLGPAAAHALAFDNPNILAAVPLAVRFARNVTALGFASLLPGGLRRYDDARAQKASRLLTESEARLGADRSYTRVS